MIKPICAGICVLLLGLGPAVAAELIQATGGEDGLYMTHQDERLLIGRLGEVATPIAAPAGADLYTLMPTVGGWVAAGHVTSDVGRPDLLLLQATDDGVALLPLPERGGGTQRGQPVPLVDGGELVGLAWVEGNSQSDLQVWAAAWNGEGWQPALPVSGPGPGSQLALAGAVLKDGSWLLVWTRFDGSDDETVFSHQSGGHWSEPRRIHEDNEVPDITPQVVAIEDGALVAWSWFDGSDYRVRTAIFEGRDWQLGKALGAKGSLYPTLIPTGQGAQLLFQTVVPETWTVVEIDSRGGLSQIASSVKRGPERPLLVPSDSGSTRFGWPSAAGDIAPSTLQDLVWEPAK